MDENICIESEIIKFNLLKQKSRQQASKYILSLVTNDVLAFKFKYILKDDKQILLIRYEIIKNGSALYQTLSCVRKQFNQSSFAKNTLVHNFIELAKILTSDRLTLKYIFNTQSHIWKLFLSTIIVLLLNHLDFLERSQLLDMMILFARTALYWSNVHWSFVIDNGFCKLLVKYIQKISNNTMYTLMLQLKHCADNDIVGTQSTDMEEIPMMSIPLLMTECLLDNIDKRKICRKYKKSLYQQYKLLMESETKMQKLHDAKCISSNIKLPKIGILWRQVYKLFIHDETMFETEIAGKKKSESLPNSSIEIKIATSESICGWQNCKNRKCKLYKCKHCQLIHYCCRNHQKKHWKYIHSQQCFHST